MKAAMESGHWAVSTIWIIVCGGAPQQQVGSEDCCQWVRLAAYRP